MIAVDTSALIAVVLDEPGKAVCMQVLKTNAGLTMSAASLVEAGIVAARRGVTSELQSLLSGLPIKVAPVTADEGRRAVDAYRLWARGSTLPG